MKIADFAALVGTSAKTIYKQIDKGRLFTVKELQNGREITLISTNDAQIREFQNTYGKLPVNEGNCEDILTYNEGEYTVNEVQNPAIATDSIKDLITMNNELQDRLMTIQERLITAEGQQLLLTDKANREGLYLQEINQLKKVNEGNTKKLLTVIICSLLLFTCMAITLVWQYFNPKTVTQEKQVIKVITVDAHGKPISVLTEKQ